MARKLAEITVPLTPLPRGPEEAQLGSYRIVALLARSNASAVYLAEHRATGERVALKALTRDYAQSAELSARLLGERAVSARVKHPGLVDVRFADRSASGLPYLVMEYVEGECLAARVARGALATAEAIAIGADAAAALAALHAGGVVHCDVKPANMIARAAAETASRAVVIDYGVARILDEPVASDAGIAGTPAYMAPEQWRGAPGPPADVYGLGCALYELLVGAPAFSGPLPRLMRAHRDAPPARLRDARPDVPLAAARVIEAALGKAPAGRPTMREVAAELAALDAAASCAGPERARSARTAPRATQVAAAG
jgi:serine/threonine protein kinase